MRNVHIFVLETPNVCVKAVGQIVGYRLRRFEMARLDTDLVEGLNSPALCDFSFGMWLEDMPLKRCLSPR